MNKTGLYLINAFITTLIGALIEILHTILEHKGIIDLSELFGSMAKGVVIGTICLFIFLNILIKLGRKPIIGFITVFTAVAFLMGALFVYDLIIMPADMVDYFRWIMAFTIAETLGLILTAGWYRWVTLYNDKLEKKKVSIND